MSDPSHLRTYPRMSMNSSFLLELFKFALLFLALRLIAMRLLRWLGASPTASRRHFYPIPWRWLAKRYFAALVWWQTRAPGAYPNGGFASALHTATRAYEPGMTYVGTFRCCGLRGQLALGIDGRGARLILGKARSGKSAHGAIQILEWDGHALIMDVDGTATHTLARRLGAGGGAVIGRGSKFCCLDFTGMLSATRQTSRWNFMDEIPAAVRRAQDRVRRRPGGASDEEIDRAGDAAAVALAQKAADALVIQDNHNQPTFANMSRDIVRGLILYVYAAEGDKSLVRVRQLLIGGLALAEGDPMDNLFRAMERHYEFGGLIARAGALGRNGKSKDGRNIATGTAITQLGWIDDPAIAYIFSASDFSVSELKIGKRNFALSLIAPVSDIKKRLAPAFRLLLNTALYTAETIPSEPTQKRALYYLDEYCALSMDELQFVPGVYPKFGIDAVFIAQELSQIKNVYRDNWETFVNNVSSVSVMATEAPSTLEWLHKTLSVRRQYYKVADAAGSQKARYEYRVVNVIEMDDLRRLISVTSDNIVVLPAGGRPFVSKNGVYFNECAVWEVDADPQYREPFQRRWMRTIVAAHLERTRQWTRPNPPSSQASPRPETRSCAS